MRAAHPPAQVDGTEEDTSRGCPRAYGVFIRAMTACGKVFFADAARVSDELPGSFACLRRPPARPHQLRPRPLPRLEASQFLAEPVNCYHLDKKVCEHFNQPQVWRSRDNTGNPSGTREIPRRDIVGFAGFKLPGTVRSRPRTKCGRSGVVLRGDADGLGRLTASSLGGPPEAGPSCGAERTMRFLTAPGITMTGNDIRLLHDSFNERIGRCIISSTMGSTR